ALLEAFPATLISPVSLGGRRERIGLISRKRHEQDSAYVWVFDLGYLMRGTPSVTGNDSQVIILRHEGKDIGILVDELHAVPRFSPSKITPAPFAPMSDTLLVREVIQANEGKLLIQALDVERLVTCIHDPSPLVLQHH